jgi:hypothetical protein
MEGASVGLRALVDMSATYRGSRIYHTVAVLMTVTHVHPSVVGYPDIFVGVCHCGYVHQKSHAVSVEIR